MRATKLLALAIKLAATKPCRPKTCRACEYAISFSSHIHTYILCILAGEMLYDIFLLIRWQEVENNVSCMGPAYNALCHFHFTTLGLSRRMSKLIKNVAKVALTNISS